MSSRRTLELLLSYSSSFISPLLPLGLGFLLARGNVRRLAFRRIGILGISVIRRTTLRVHVFIEFVHWHATLFSCCRVRRASFLVNAHVRAREYAETCRPSRSSRLCPWTVRGFALRSARARGDVWVNRFPRPEGRVYAETHWLSVGVGAVCERHAQEGAPSRKTGGHRPQDRVRTGTVPSTSGRRPQERFCAGTPLRFSIAGIFKLTFGFVGYSSEVVAECSAVTRPRSHFLNITYTVSARLPGGVCWRRVFDRRWPVRGVSVHPFSLSLATTAELIWFVLVHCARFLFLVPSDIRSSTCFWVHLLRGASLQSLRATNTVGFCTRRSVQSSHFTTTLVQERWEHSEAILSFIPGGLNFASPL